MARIYAETGKISQLTSDLKTDQEEFSKLKKEMNTIVTELQVSWDGIDAETFIIKAENYLSSLTEIENETLTYSNRISKKLKRYNDSYAAYQEAIKKLENVQR